MLNILFVLYYDFSSNSAVHVHHFANNLVKLGLDCIVAVPDNKTSVSGLGDYLYKVAEFPEIDRLQQLFTNQQGPDVVHCWTPREIVRKYYQQLRSRFSFKLFIHLEDNEEHLLEKFLNQPLKKLLQDKSLQVPDNLSHPIRYQQFLTEADGVTVIVDELKKFVPSQIPTLRLPPGADTELFFPRKADSAIATSLSILLSTIVICYTGNVHAANACEVRSIYLAVAMLNREGIPTVLVRTGKDFCDFLGQDESWARKHSIEMGYVDRAKLPEILALADILIQPGKADDFNIYRFPSKLPEFLAMGKPVILPKANIGNSMEHMNDAIVLPVVDAISICKHVNLIIGDKELKDKLSNGALNFAKTQLDWMNNSKLLKSFYQSFFDIVKQGQQVTPTVLLDEFSKQKIIDKYLGKGDFSELNYATVRDFCDSADNLPQICYLDGDLKNVQRPWAMKAILSHVPPQGKLLEIGGGVPLVACMLAELGYEVTVVDPYEGAGNGPTEYQNYLQIFPNVNIVKDLFGVNLQGFELGYFDCIYSISVLEHIPEEGIKDVFAGIRKFLRPGGFSIHCVDNVIQGEGVQLHEDRVKLVLHEQKQLINSNYSLDNDYEELLVQLKEDLETYYLSALGHHQWRCGMSYEDFPFRKVISVQSSVAFTDGK
jgi:glycosyltransferase involved in cell wall biosynthesis/SAM-dependent methyltransferase